MWCYLVLTSCCQVGGCVVSGSDCARGGPCSNHTAPQRSTQQPLTRKEDCCSPAFYLLVMPTLEKLLCSALWDSNYMKPASLARVQCCHNKYQVIITNKCPVRSLIFQTWNVSLRQPPWLSIISLLLPGWASSGEALGKARETPSLELPGLGWEQTTRPILVS